MSLSNPTHLAYAENILDRIEADPTKRVVHSERTFIWKMMRRIVNAAHPSQYEALDHRIEQNYRVFGNNPPKQTRKRDEWERAEEAQKQYMAMIKERVKKNNADPDYILRTGF